MKGLAAVGKEQVFFGGKYKVRRFKLHERIDDVQAEFRPSVGPQNRSLYGQTEHKSPIFKISSRGP